MLLQSFKLLLYVTLLLSCYAGRSAGEPGWWERFYCSLSETLVSSECCSSARVDFKYIEFQRALRQKLFGQPKTADILAKAVSKHWDNHSKPSKALVLALHGPTGVGKTFVTKILADYTFAYGQKSQFYHFFPAKNNFEDPKQSAKYIDQLHAWIQGNVSYCDKSLFVFDEVEKMPLQIFDSLKPFLDYESVINGIDFSRCIFVFLSNVGSEVIVRDLTDWKREGKDRATFPLDKLDRKVSEHAFDSGDSRLKGSELLRKGLISHFLPFLPLEKEQVVQCIKEYLAESGNHRFASDTNFISGVLDETPFMPDEKKLFARFGCKRVAEKVDQALVAWEWDKDQNKKSEL